MKPIYSGKVREIYEISDKQLVIVTTDRISAFDHILPMPVKGKGIVLNTLSNFWFDKTKDIVANHIIDDRLEKMPSYFHEDSFKGRTVLVEKCEMFPYEFVVRGYLFGNLWEAYKNKKSFCDIRLPEHYELAQKLEQPVLTPALKRDAGHDEYISLRKVSAGLGKEITDRIVEICYRLYERCAGYALSRGLIIADAKFEFGRNRRGELVLADEIFTPDASRYWDAAQYKVGVSPRSFDKQFLRDWLTEHSVNGTIPFDSVPESVLTQTEKLYWECLHRLTAEASLQDTM